MRGIHILGHGCLVALVMQSLGCGGDGKTPLATTLSSFQEPRIADVKDLGARTYLTDGWSLHEAASLNGDDASISGQTVDPRGWIPAKVPGTVLTSLVEQGVYPEPLYGLNNLQIPESLNKNSYWYRVGFDVPVEYQGKAVWLNFDGINYEAQVWVNGRKLGDIHGAFKRERFDVSRIAHVGGSNVLAVKIVPPPNPGVPHEQTLSEAGHNGGVLGLDSPTFVATIGWDWIPGIRDRNIGIWQDVYLNATGPVAIRHPQVITDLPLPRTDEAQLKIVTELANLTNLPQDGVLRGRWDDVTVEQVVRLAAGETRKVTLDSSTHPQLLIAHPRLWWPNGYGAQELYDLDLQFVVLGQPSDSKQIRFGVREMSYVGGHREATDVSFAKSQARYVRMYGMARSSNSGFALKELEVYAAAGTGANLAIGKAASASSSTNGHAAGNANDGNPKTSWQSSNREPEWLQVDLGASHEVNRVRLDWDRDWGRVYKIQTSLDAAQWTDVHSVSIPELQFLVNGHKIMARGGNWGLDEAMKRNDTRRLDAQFRFHRDANVTMIRNWVGMTDDEDFYDAADKYGILIWDDFWLANPLDGPDPSDPARFIDNARDKILRYRNHPSIALWCGRNEGFPPSVIDDALESAVKDLDGTRRYQRSSADDGVHGRGPYRYQDPVLYYTKHSRGFSSEIGTPSIPTVESIREMMPAKDLWPINDTWGYHDYTGGACGAKDFTQAMSARYGAPSGVVDFARKGQLMNYDNYRAIFEAFNRKMWNDTSGVLLWMSHPAQPSFVWQLYDYYLEPTAALFGTKKANEPLHIQLNLDDLNVVVVNHTASKRDGLRANVLIINADGTEAANTTRVVNAASNTATRAFPLVLPNNLSPVYFVKLELRDANSNLVSDNFYWRALKNNDFTDLAKLPEVDLEAEAVVRTCADVYTIDVTLRNPAHTVAVQARLKNLRDRTSERVLPVFYEDNYFSLVPGESKRVTMEFASSNLGGESPRVELEGWNVKAKRVNLRPCP